MLHALEAKTSEYQNLPGLILGLDGWVLRSIPKELRGTFLAGYRKLLNITFHPDRTQNEERKRAFQNYLQTVSEAVEFLVESEMNYELAVDVVPTRLNPIVQLKRNAEASESALGSMAERLKEATDQIQPLSARAEQAERRADTVVAELRNLERAHFEMRQALATFSRRCIFPVNGPEIKLWVVFLDLAETDDVLRQQFTGQMTAGRPGKACNRYLSVGEQRWRIFGAMTPVHVREWVGDRKNVGAWIRSEFAAEHLGAVTSFTVPFMAVGMFLVLEDADHRRQLAFITKDENKERLTVIERGYAQRFRDLHRHYETRLSSERKRYAALEKKRAKEGRRA